MAGSQRPPKVKGTRKPERPRNPVSCKQSKPPVRRIRVQFEDPDATDSSSDEMMDSINKNKKTVVYDIVISPSIKKSSQNNRGVAKTPQTQRSRGAKPPRSATSSSSTSTCKFKGVRQRSWGKWAAEIRDTIRGVRLWLGTFDTAEEARQVYEAAAMRLQAEKNSLLNVSSFISSTASGLSEAQISSSYPGLTVPPFSHPSTSSVLDVSRTTGSQLDGQQHPPAAAAAAPITELLEQTQDQFVIPEMDFGLGDETFLVGDLDEDFLGLDDLPFWAQEIDDFDLPLLDDR